MLIVGKVDGTFHSLLVACNCGSEEVFRGCQDFYNLCPRCIFYCIQKFIANLFVGNVTLPFVAIVCQISKMNQHREHIIFASHNMHVILELECVDIYTFSRQHTDDIILQSIEIHLDIGDDRVVGSCGCPIASANASLQGFHHRIWIVDGFFLSDVISVVPCLQIVHGCVVPFGKHLHFVFGKSIA